MEQMISKSKFKPRALHYFHEIERTGPVLKIVPYAEDPKQTLKALRKTVRT